MDDVKKSLFDVIVNRRIFFYQDIIYTAYDRSIFQWNRKTKELISVINIPKNDNLNKGVMLCVDADYIYFNSIYFFHVMDKKTNEIIYQKQFGTNNSSDFDLGVMLVDDNFIYFPQRNSGVVVVDKTDYENIKYLNKDKKSMWAVAQDDSMLYMGGVAKTIHRFNKPTFSSETVYAGHKGNIHSVYPYNDFFISSSADNSIIVWNKNDGTIYHRIRNAGSSWGKVSMNDTHIICTIHNTIKIWEISNWNLVAEVKIPGNYIYDEDIFYFIKDKNIASYSIYDVITNQSALNNN